MKVIPFLKAFVKLFEKDLRDIDAKMQSLPQFKYIIMQNIIDFLYSHIDNTLRNKDVFEKLFYSNKEDFSSLYCKICSVIKKKAKALRTKITP